MIKKEFLGVNAGVEFEFLMEDYSRRLDRKNIRIEADNVIELGREIEQVNLVKPKQYKLMNEVVEALMNKAEEDESEEPILGPVFTTGINDGIGVIALLPARRNDILGEGVGLAEVVKATPALIQFQDRQLAQEIKSLSYRERIMKVQEIIDGKVGRIRDGSAK